MNEKISRSEQKRQFKQFEIAAKELSDLGDASLRRLPGSEQLKEELVAVRKVKGGARKRQVKYIAKVLQREPVDVIFQFLKKERGSQLEESRFLHQAEKIRDEIVNEALQAFDHCRRLNQPWELDWKSKTIDLVLTQLSDIDEHELRRLAHQYARTRNKTNYREIFRIIKAATDKQRLSDHSLFP